MRDTELYRHLLGLVAPWGVDRVELSASDGRVDVWVQHVDRTRFACPDCERELAVYDHSAERAWRHLDSCAFLTFLHASPPRVRCRTPGRANNEGEARERPVENTVFGGGPMQFFEILEAWRQHGGLPGLTLKKVGEREWGTAVPWVCSITARDAATTVVGDGA
jgi:hypothetical protein